MIIVDLLGDPIAWKRPAHVVRKGRCTIFDSQKKEKDQVRWQIKHFYQSENLISCPIEVELFFYFRPPKTSKIRTREMLLGSSKHMSKPDVDNCAKFYLDCLKDIVIADDCIIFRLSATKLYSETPSVKIRIIAHHLHDGISIYDGKTLGSCVNESGEQQ